MRNSRELDLLAEGRAIWLQPQLPHPPLERDLGLWVAVDEEDAPRPARRGREVAAKCGTPAPSSDSSAWALKPLTERPSQRPARSTPSMRPLRAPACRW